MPMTPHCRKASSDTYVQSTTDESSSAPKRALLFDGLEESIQSRRKIIDKGLRHILIAEFENFSRDPLAFSKPKKRESIKSTFYYTLATSESI